jgi:membrane associated rhomboid family serine protease
MTEPRPDLDRPDAADRESDPAGGRRPPSGFHEAGKYPVTAAVGLAAVGLTVGLWLGWDADALVVDSRVAAGQVWRLPGSALPHLGVIHLLFNLSWLWAFGTAVERGFGSRAAAGIYLLLATGASAAQYGFVGPGVGLSGVVYGLFGLLMVLRRDPRFAGVVTQQAAGLLVVCFVVCWPLTWAGVLHVGNMAHAAGAVLGVLIGLAVAARGAGRAAAGAALAAATAVAVVAALVRPPTAEELAYRGWQDMQAGRDERAVERLEKAVEERPDEADWWVYLGYSRQRLGRVQPAVAAYRQVLRLRPQDKDARPNLAQLLAHEGYVRHTAGDLAGAAERYRESTTLDGSATWVWFNLGLASHGRGDFDAARTAFRRAAELDPTDPQYRAAAAELPDE